MDELIKVSNVTKSFNGATILEDINLDVISGETIGIIGPNGCGKSVLFKLICGFLKPESGHIYIRGEQLGLNFDLPDNVGVLINSPGYIELYSGFKNLQFLAGIKNNIDDKKIIDVMELVGLDPNNKTKVKDYSMGMKQKLGIAQAIMEDQDIIILDEPFNALDFKTYKDIKDIIQILKKNGKTILLTSHNHSDIEEMCNQIYIVLNKKLQLFTNELKETYFQ